ncbi:MAG: metal-dependent hydrolase [Rubrivivax sp.]|nr:metal-dependent hydrolase [Rubrivivax sp.]
MSYTVRRLQVDLETPWPRHWAGDAFRSAWFNALSFSFPAGEQLFIDAVKMGLGRLDDAGRAQFADEVQGFIGQEATHRRIHQRFNAQLEAQGYVNHWEGRIGHRMATQLAGQDPRAWLGVTAATEHFTALFAEWLLTEPAVLADAEPRLRDLWLWHASEESEHRSTAFDLYRALGGNEVWRRRLYLTISLHFFSDLARQTLHNLWRDGHWWRPATWAGAWRLTFGRHGLVRHAWRPWRRYLTADFHPSEGDGAPAAAWLAAHGDLAPPVQRGHAPPG